MWHSGLRGSGDSLLRAAVVCDLLHNLAVAFVSHDLMVSTKLKKRHAKSPAVPGLDILSPPCTGRIHSFLSGQPKAGLTDLQEGAEHIQLTLALQWGISHEPHHSCRKDPSCSGLSCPSCPSQEPPPPVRSFPGSLPLRQREASILFKVHPVWERDNSENKHRSHSITSHTPTNMSTAILLRLLSLSSMRDSWIGTCEGTKRVVSQRSAGTDQKRDCTTLSD